MIHSDLNTLEFDGIRRILARLTLTPYGDEAARALAPAPDLAIARRMQLSVSAARHIVDAGNQPRLGTVPDVRAALRQAAQTGAALSVSALAHLRTLTHVAGKLSVLAASYPDVCPESGDLLAPQAFTETIDHIINEHGRLREDASTLHITLYRQFHAAESEVRVQLKAMIASPEYAGAFSNQEPIHWQGFRAVLLVKPSFSDRIKGVRRGTSSGGRDVLIEPVAVVMHNNRLEAINGQIEAQNQEVLRQTTDIVREHTPAIQKLIDAIAWTDLALAGGQFSAALNAIAPELVDTPTLALTQAYHPQLLLQFQQRQITHVVPLSLVLDDSQAMLVITGPNTGGKTVVLKTVGLLVTMAHCGLHLPAEGACIVGNFNRVIVDVGDKQSLHHHLSTFAGHVTVLRRLLEEADSHTLVLMDELGTGTDPEEGAALAMAVLDELATRKVRGIVTTHLSPLKLFASEHPYLHNASMRFDYTTLTPTYQIETGQAGSSLGLIIAEKNGLPATLLEQARHHLERIRQGQIFN